MFEILETERLKLIKVEEKHAKDLWDDFFIEYDYRKYSTQLKMESFDEYLEIVKSYKTLYQTNEYYRWLVTLKETGETVGMIRLYDLDEDNHLCKISCNALKTKQENGYIAESTLKVIDFAFNKLKMHRIVGEVVCCNERSVKLCETLKFKKESIQKEAYFVDGRYIDQYLMVLLNKKEI